MLARSYVPKVIFLIFAKCKRKGMRAKRFLLIAVAWAMVLAAPAVLHAASPKKPQHKGALRVLYWNIQNGMWAGQPDNYNKFVEWVKEWDPDVCIFCEAGSIYYTGTHTHMPNEERYLPAHWGELCARWGHDYHFVVPRRPSTSTPFGLTNYPDAVTSRFPIDSIKIVKGSKPDSVVVTTLNSLW